MINKSAMTDMPLVMDIGMYDGSDTAYYLHLGYRVVSVEANPGLIAKARSRFRDAIASGQLTLLNVAIAQNAVSLKLYISERDQGSSTLNRQNLETRGEASIEEVEVKGIPFSAILKEYGTPYYLKIDIEGSDHFCLEAIDPASPPSYVSWELGNDAMDCLHLMHRKGYTRFKIIHQSTFYDVPTIKSVKYRINRKLRRLFSFPEMLYSPHKDWTFTREHSAGPCCEYTPGRWLSFEDTIRIWTDFCQGSLAWYDVHAALPIIREVR